MATCSFCGHDNVDDARSCVACGFVFTTVPGEGGPTGVPPPDDGPGHLAGLYDPEPIDQAARQVAIMAVASAALAVAITITAAASTADALGELGSGATVFFTAPDVPDVAGRADLLTLAEHSLFAGVLVIFGGWAQVVGAARSLLGVADVDRNANAMLRAFVVIGPNVVNAGRALRELWTDNTPPDRGPTAVPAIVRWFGIAFGAAVVTRVGSIVWGYVFAPIPTTDGDALIAGLVVIVTRLIWIATLVTGVFATRAVGEHQRRRATALTDPPRS